MKPCPCGCGGVAEFVVGNNTDLRGHPLETSSVTAARRLWRAIKPRASAGNRYSAYARYRCHRCGAWQTLDGEARDCEC